MRVEARVGPFEEELNEVEAACRDLRLWLVTEPELDLVLRFERPVKEVRDWVGWAECGGRDHAM